MKNLFFRKIQIGVVVLLIILGILGITTHRKLNPKYMTQTTSLNSTPTLFFHGYGSSYHAEDHMVQAAVKAGVTKTVIQAMVSRTGQVSLRGTIAKNAVNPIVEVNYADNRNADYHTDGKWAKNVVVALQQKYNIKNINMVGHSMGNMAIMYYLLDNYQNKKLPTLQKQVDIAGHFNGILGMNDKPNQMQLNTAGKPAKMDKDYQELLKLKTTYSKQTKVLNIYGDKGDGTHSDGRVSNASSQSLKYIVANRAKSYSEKKITGPNAQHSKLHDNKQVDQLLINFLWK